MSYDLIGKFFIDDKFIAESDMNRLKICNDYRYSVTLNHVEPIAPIENIDIGDDREDGKFFNFDSFKNAYKVYKKLYKKAKKNLNKKKALMETTEFYQMSADAKDDYFEDLSMETEDLEDLKFQKNACRYIVDLFAYYKYDYVNPLEKDEKGNQIYYPDNREVILYIFAV